MAETRTEVDTSRVSDLLGDLQAALGEAGQPADLSDITRDETRRLIVEITKITPPQTKAVGEGAVKRDINSLFSGAQAGLIDTVGAAHGLFNIDTYITGKDGKKTHLRWDRIDPLGANMSKIHNASRNQNGGIPRRTAKPVQGEWRARVVVPEESKASYLKMTLSHVGRWKASWAATAKALGVQGIAGWIARHISGNQAPKGFHDTTGLMTGNFPTVTFGSRAPGVGRQRNNINDSVRIRAEAIKRRIELLVSGYNKDIANGMKIQRRASRSGQGGRYAIG
jgi:hypothetical protein